MGAKGDGGCGAKSELTMPDNDGERRVVVIVVRRILACFGQAEGGSGCNERAGSEQQLEMVSNCHFQS